MPKISEALAMKVIDRKKERRMDAYYFGFDETGVEIVDQILAAVAAAGKGSHHTECWDQYPNEEFSYIDAIQHFAEHAAMEVKKISAMYMKEAAEHDELKHRMEQLEK